jgi:hypothetical protein
LIACQASLHYGERWGRLWLDAARYADSDGYENDKQRWVCFYRDWVINALNHDMPFDEFTIEQLAGELLPHATLDQKIATGFHRNTMINEEGGVDQEQYHRRRCSTVWRPRAQFFWASRLVALSAMITSWKSATSRAQRTC